MKFTLSYRKKILIYFSIIIAVFTVGIIVFEQNRVKQERMANLENIGCLCRNGSSLYFRKSVI